MLNVALLLISIFLNSLAQIFLKSASAYLNSGKDILAVFFDVALSIPFILGMICYALSIIIWVVVLSKIALSIAYPMQALGYVFGVSMAVLFLKESINLSMIAGLLFIILGVFILGKNIT